MKKKFENKTAVITGGASGIGLAIGRIFGASGASVAIIDFDKNAIENSVKTLSSEGITCSGYF
jgi:NAD(P)-dependent dehydrogenase (short-subunit alcohol dehydrogenase family)